MKLGHRCKDHNQCAVWLAKILYCEIVKVGAFNKEKVLVGAFSVIVKSSWTFVSSSTNNPRISRAGDGLLPVLLGAGLDPLLHEVPRADHPRGEGVPAQGQMCQDGQEAAAHWGEKQQPVSI